jgi:hypothetical protein
VLSVSGLAALVAELTTARGASEASQAELRRLQVLAGQSNASPRAVQAAQAAAVRDQTLVQSAQLRLVADWGGAIAGNTDLPSLVESLGTLGSALIRFDLPAGTSIPAQPMAARVHPAAAEHDLVTTQFLGPTPAVDPQLQSSGFFFLVTTNAGRLTPGAAVTGWIAFPGEPKQGVSLPADAVVRHNGLTWVYLQTADDTFRRIPVTLEIPVKQGWLISAGLKPQDKVVVVGAQQLLSQELSANASEE